MNQDKTRTNLIKDHLQKEYGLKADKISKGPRGFVAETYIVEVDHRKYFIKMVKKGRYDHNLVKSVEVQNKLCKLGLKQIPCPITSKSGSSSTVLREFTFIVFNFIEGKWTFEYKDEELLDIVANLHEIKPELIGEIESENFELPYSEKLGNILEEVYTYKLGGEFETKTRKYLEPFKDEIDKDWTNFGKLIKQCRSENFDFCITHEDPWGNALITERGDVYLFDWDDIALAPVERDLWFKLDNPDVVKYYKKSFPEYEVNKFAYDYYLYNRYFYDLYAFLVEIFSERPEKHKEDNYKLILKDWNGWLRTLIRKRIGSYL